MENEHAYRKQEFWETNPKEAEEFSNLERQYGDQYYKSGMIRENGARHPDLEKRFGELLSMRARFYDQEQAKFLVGFRPEETQQERRERMEQGARDAERAAERRGAASVNKNVVEMRPREATAPAEEPEHTRKAAA